MDEKTIRIAVCVVLTALYAAGLILMFFQNLLPGLLLWVISTVGGMGYLYYLRQQRERAEAEKAEAQTHES